MSVASSPATRGESHHVAGAPLSPILITSHCYILSSHCDLLLIYGKCLSLFSELLRQLNIPRVYGTGKRQEMCLLFYGSPDWIGSVLSRGTGYGVSAESGFPEPTF